jgi:hypothetical protein
MNQPGHLTRRTTRTRPRATRNTAWRLSPVLGGRAELATRTVRPGTTHDKGAGPYPDVVHHIRGDHPQIACRHPQVIDRYPQVIDSRPHISGSRPRIGGNTLPATLTDPSQVEVIPATTPARPAPRDRSARLTPWSSQQRRRRPGCLRTRFCTPPQFSRGCRCRCRNPATLPPAAPPLRLQPRPQWLRLARIGALRWL